VVKLLALSIQGVGDKIICKGMMFSSQRFEQYAGLSSQITKMCSLVMKIAEKIKNIKINFSFKNEL
jgi:hypothetical protein